MYDDAVELQQFFVTQRDKLCKDGERFVSPALVFIKRHLLQDLDEERKSKADTESKEDEKQKELEKGAGKQHSQVSTTSGAKISLTMNTVFELICIGYRYLTNPNNLMDWNSCILNQFLSMTLWKIALG